MAASSAQPNREVKVDTLPWTRALRGLTTAVTLVLCLLAPGGALLGEREVEMGSTLVPLSEHLYLLKDTCNVYLIKDGDSALAVDFGSGMVLDHLQELGVSHLEWVLHTHYHRDQCQGDARAVGAGARLAVPEAERTFSERASDLWASGEIPAGFVHSGGFAIRESVPVAQGLVPGEAFQWRGYRFQILATPCQTPDSLTLVTEVDGRRVAFSGDLIARPGQVWDFGQLQWNYLRYEGLQALPASIDIVRQAEPHLLCPSHGDCMDQPALALTELELRAKRVESLICRPTIGRWNWSDLVRVSPHLFKDAGTTSYIILSDDGHALFFDLGEFKPGLFDELRDRYGVTAVDAVVVSHFHGDHTNGIPELVRRFGSEVWALAVEADILEHPEKYAMSFKSPLRLTPDRLFRDAEVFDWRGYELTFLHLPAHTEYHLGLLATVDGKPTLFTGDAVGHTGANELSASFVCRNRIFLGSGAVKTARQMLRYGPYVVCPAHSDPFVSGPEQRRQYLDWALAARDAIAGLIAQPHPEMGFDPYWVRIEPYRIGLRAGAKAECRIVVKNHLAAATGTTLTLALPETLRAEPQSFAGEIGPGGERSFPFVLTATDAAQAGRLPIAVDVVFAERRWGELTEAIVEVAE